MVRGKWWFEIGPWGRYLGFSTLIRRHDVRLPSLLSSSLFSSQHPVRREADGKLISAADLCLQLPACCSLTVARSRSVGRLVGQCWVAR